MEEILEQAETVSTPPDGGKLKLLHQAMTSDEVFSQVVPADFNSFVKDYSDPKKIKTLYDALKADEVFSQVVPNTFEAAVYEYGLGKPQATPSSASGLATQQPSGLTPQAQSVQPIPSQPSEEPLAGTSGSPDFGFGSIVENVGKETPISQSNERLSKMRGDGKKEESFAGNLYESLARGSARLGQSMAETPAFIYDLAAMPQNYIADKFDIPELKASSEQVGKMMGMDENAIAEYYRGLVNKSQSKFQEKYDKGITEYLSKGDYSKGFGLLANQVAESAPVTLSLMMGNAAGVGTAASVTGSGLVFGADKKAELDREAPWMSEQDKLNAATMYGFSEGLFEQFGITKIGGVVSKILKESGKEEAKKIAAEGFKQTYGKILKQYFGTMTEEALSEAATQFTQNAISKYSGEKPDQDLLEGVSDAFIVGMGASSIYGTAPAIAQAAKTKKGIKEQKAIQEEKAQITQSIESPDLTDAVKGALAEKLKQLNEKEADIVIADNEIYSALPEPQQKQVDAIQEEADAMTDALRDPNLTPDAKVVLEEKVSQLEDEKDSILQKTEAKPSAETETLTPNTPTNDERQSNNQQEAGSSQEGAAASEVGNGEGRTAEEVKQGAEQAPALEPKLVEVLQPAPLDGKNYISVYHGGSVNDISEADDNLYVSEDKAQAQAYAEGNGGEVREFKINKNDIANESEVRKVIVELGLQSKEEGWDLSEELMLHEILDPNFSTSLSDSDLEMLHKELTKRGYKAVEMNATDITGGKRNINDILVLKPKETLKRPASNKESQTPKITTNESTKIEGAQQVEPVQEGGEGRVGDGAELAAEDRGRQEGGADKGKAASAIPAVVFHATEAKFEGLPKKVSGGKTGTFNEPAGIYYSTNPKAAQKATGKTGEQRVVEAEFKPKNPLLIADDRTDEIYNAAMEKAEADVREQLGDEEFDVREQAQDEGLGDMVSEAFAKNLTDQGYDAVVNQRNGDVIVLDESVVSEPKKKRETEFGNKDNIYNFASDEKEPNPFASISVQEIQDARESNSSRFVGQQNGIDNFISTREVWRRDNRDNGGRKTASRNGQPLTGRLFTGHKAPFSVFDRAFRGTGMSNQGGGIYLSSTLDVVIEAADKIAKGGYGLRGEKIEGEPHISEVRLKKNNLLWAHEPIPAEILKRIGTINGVTPSPTSPAQAFIWDLTNSYVKDKKNFNDYAEAQNKAADALHDKGVTGYVLETYDKDKGGYQNETVIFSEDDIEKISQTKIIESSESAVSKKQPRVLTPDQKLRQEKRQLLEDASEWSKLSKKDKGLQKNIAAMVELKKRGAALGLTQGYETSKSSGTKMTFTDSKKNTVKLESIKKIADDSKAIWNGQNYSAQEGDGKLEFYNSEGDQIDARSKEYAKAYNEYVRDNAADFDSGNESIDLDAIYENANNNEEAMKKFVDKVIYNGNAFEIAENWGTIKTVAESSDTNVPDATKEIANAVGGMRAEEFAKLFDRNYLPQNSKWINNASTALPLDIRVGDWTSSDALNDMKQFVAGMDASDILTRITEIIQEYPAGPQSVPNNQSSTVIEEAQKQFKKITGLELNDASAAQFEALAKDIENGTFDSDTYWSNLSDEQKQELTDEQERTFTPSEKINQAKQGAERKPSEVSGATAETSPASEESESVIAEMDAVYEKKGLNFKASKAKFDAKYGAKAKQAVDINRNFDKYKDQLYEAGVIIDVKC